MATLHLHVFRSFLTTGRVNNNLVSGEPGALEPDLKIIFSCDISWPSHGIRDEYIDFFKLGLFKNLASKTSASYLIEAKEDYIDPRESRFLQFLGNNNKMTIWEILDSPNPDEPEPNILKKLD